MRNLTKFLALVLAMLMVSTGALSVSAAFADQDEVNAHDYAKAMEELYDLGVIAGKESADGSVAFDPEGDLTREEAAVIAAKLIAGSKQTIDWSVATTCRFTDVTAKWSFGYIEYAADRGVLDGTGNGKYNPKGTLDVASAVAIAVKALGLRNEVEYYDSIAKPTTWYLNWIKVAEDAGLLVDVNPFSYGQKCSRAMMAQIAFNALNATKGKDLMAGFENLKKSIEGTLTLTSAGVVITNSTTSETFDTAAFNEQLDGITADQLVNCIVEVKWNDTTNRITDVDVLTSTLAVDYANGALAIVKDEPQITLGGKTYTVGNTAADPDSSNNGIIGGAITTKYTIVATIDDGTSISDGSKCTLPTYYAGYAYDDDNDGVYNRVELKTYNLANIKNAAKVKYEGKDIESWTITYLDGTTPAVTTTVPTTFAGVTGVIDGETPLLINYTDNVVTVHAVAEAVAGVLTNYSERDEYVTVGGTKYAFAKDASVSIPAAWGLNQTVTIFVLNGKYIAVTTASKAAVLLIVDTVSVKDGVAVVTGYNPAKDYAVETITVKGLLDGKAVNYTAKQDTFKKDDKTYNKYVELGETKNDKWVEVATFIEAGFYSFVKIGDNYYVDASTLVENTYKIYTGKDGAKTDLKGHTATRTLYSFYAENQNKWADPWQANDYNWNAVGAYKYVNEEAINKADSKYVYMDITGDTANDNHPKWADTNGNCDSNGWHQKDYTHETANCQPVPFYFVDETNFTFMQRNAADKATTNPYADTYTLAETVDFGTACARPVLFNSTFGADDLVAPTTANISATANAKNTVSLIYLDGGKPGTNDVTTTTKTALDAGMSIAQILKNVETAYDTATYDAFDILTGKKVEITSTNMSISEGTYVLYNTADGVDAKDAEQVKAWLRNNNLTYKTFGVMTSLEAAPITSIAKKSNESTWTVTTGDAKAYTDITVYEANDAGVIQFKDDGTVKTLDATETFTEDETVLSYIVGDTMIIILNK